MVILEYGTQKGAEENFEKEHGARETIQKQGNKLKRRMEHKTMKKEQRHKEQGAKN